MECVFTQTPRTWKLVSHGMMFVFYCNQEFRAIWIIADR